jgi:4-hydroxybenzoate polyprenyltransferase
VNFLRKLIDLILYSSLWIAIGAAAQVQLTYTLFGIPQGLDIYTLFVFASTIGLYGLHRLIGIDKVRAFAHEGRFAVIKKFRSHIIAYSIIGFIAGAVLILLLPSTTWLYLVLPIAITAAYVIPTSKTGRRLRDFHLIKIFLLASSWSLLTTTVPLLNAGYTEAIPVAMIFIERFLFVIAITIPFDIRDIEVDTATGLRTLPHQLGVPGSKILALLLLMASAGIAFLLLTRGVYPNGIIWPYSVFLVITAVLIWGSRTRRGDYYYSGLLDGTMLLLYLLLVIEHLV